MAVFSCRLKTMVAVGTLIIVGSKTSRAIFKDCLRLCARDWSYTDRKLVVSDRKPRVTAP